MKTPILESRLHGSDSLNLAIYDHSLVRPKAMGLKIPIHWHPEYEIIYIHRGTPVFDIGGTPYSMAPGQALFVNRNAIHSCDEERNESIHYTCVVFGEKFVFPSPEDGLLQAHFLPLHRYEAAPPVYLPGDTPWQREVLSHIARMIGVQLEGGPGCAVHTRARLTDILYILLHESAFAPLGRRAGDTADHVRAAILTIHQRYHENISIRALADAQNLCHEYFSRLFRSKTGITPQAYIQKYRIDQAAHLLASSRHSIKDIASRCGFEDINYFSRCFRQTKGISPTSFRKQAPKAAEG